MSKSHKTYQKRINTVIDFISNNLDKQFSLEELASIAHFSPYYFHRIFVAIIGEPLNVYTNRIRIEKSAKLLKFSKKRIFDIAYECGYSSPSTFSRSFKNHFNLSPAQFRKTGEIKNSKICKVLFPIENYLCDMSLEEKKLKFPIEIKKLPKRKIAYIRVINSYKEGAVIKAFEKLILWSKSKKCYSNGTFFGMSLDDPLITPKHKYRYEACVTVPNTFKLDNNDRIQLMSLPQCKYATTKISGGINLVATAIHYMYNEWLINSTYEPEHTYGLEYFLDKKNICNWDHFDLELYIPVKPITNY